MTCKCFLCSLVFILITRFDEWLDSPSFNPVTVAWPAKYLEWHYILLSKARRLIHHQPKRLFGEVLHQMGLWLPDAIAWNLTPGGFSAKNFGPGVLVIPRNWVANSCDICGIPATWIFWVKGKRWNTQPKRDSWSPAQEWRKTKAFRLHQARLHLLHCCVVLFVKDHKIRV